MIALEPQRKLGPARPGLIRAVPTEEGCGSIEIEVWEMSYENIGKLLELVSEPLGFGTVELKSGERVKGFICEGWGGVRESVEGMGWGWKDITEFGGWRKYCESNKL